MDTMGSLPGRHPRSLRSSPSILLLAPGHLMMTQGPATEINVRDGMDHERKDRHHYCAPSPPPVASQAPPLAHGRPLESQPPESREPSLGIPHHASYSFTLRLHHTIYPSSVYPLSKRHALDPSFTPGDPRPKAPAKALARPPSGCAWERGKRPPRGEEEGEEEDPGNVGNVLEGNEAAVAARLAGDGAGLATPPKSPPPPLSPAPIAKAPSNFFGPTSRYAFSNTAATHAAPSVGKMVAVERVAVLCTHCFLNQEHN
jgi:hypothetical protein